MVTAHGWTSSSSMKLFSNETADIDRLFRRRVRRRTLPARATLGAGQLPAWLRAP